MKAWLLTWQWSTKPPEDTEHIVAIFPSRWGNANVKEMTEWLYALHTSSAIELAEYAKHPDSMPYRAEFDSFNGVPHSDQMHCGHQPWIYARYVSDLKIGENDAGMETLSWRNPDSYRLAEDGSGPEVAWEGRPESYTRTVRGSLHRR